MLTAEFHRKLGIDTMFSFIVQSDRHLAALLIPNDTFGLSVKVGPADEQVEFTHSTLRVNRSNFGGNMEFSRYRG